METLADLLSTGANLLIAFGYLGIGLYVAPKFRFGRNPSGGSKVAKWSAIIFFATCAMTHIDLAYHAWTNTPVDFDNLSHMAVCIIQAIAAPNFLIFASMFLNIRIEGKETV